MESKPGYWDFCSQKKSLLSFKKQKKSLSSIYSTTKTFYCPFFNNPKCHFLHFQTPKKVLALPLKSTDNFSLGSF